MRYPGLFPALWLFSFLVAAPAGLAAPNPVRLPETDEPLIWIADQAPVPPPGSPGEMERGEARGPAGAGFNIHVPPPGSPHGFGPPLGKWWKNSEIVQKLQLSEAQASQIEQTFLEHRLKLIDLRAELEKQEARLQPLIESDQPDEAKVGPQIDLLTAARGRLEKANAMMMLAIRRALTLEQWKKLQAIRQEHERTGVVMFRHRMAPLVPLPAPVPAPPPQ